MTFPTRLTAVCALAAASLTAPGCAVPKEKYDRTATQLTEAREALRKLQGDRDGLQAVVIDQQKQIRVLQRLGEGRMEKLFHVRRIALGRYTGGADLDGVEGDDGIKVYLRPIDQEGSVVKTAGEVRIGLFDLAADPQDNLIGEYEFTVEQVSKQWSGGFMAYHFSFECPWKLAPPARDEITVRVQFTDYLTGKVFTAQKLCKVKLPPLPVTAETRPAK